MEIFKTYPINGSYEVGNNGTIKYKGRIIRNGFKDKPILINLVSTEVLDMVSTCFKGKEGSYKLSTKPHHRKGIKHSAEAKQKISNSKLKKVIIKDVEYKSTSAAAKQLNVNRSTIFRYLRDIIA